MTWHGNAFCNTGPLWGESTGPVDSPHKGPVIQSFDIVFDVGLNKLWNKKSSCWWSIISLIAKFMGPTWGHSHTMDCSTGMACYGGMAVATSIIHYFFLVHHDGPTILWCWKIYRVYPHTSILIESLCFVLLYIYILMHPCDLWWFHDM